MAGVTPASAATYQYRCDTITSAKDQKVKDRVSLLGQELPASGTVGMGCSGPDGVLKQEVEVHGGKGGNPAYICTSGDNRYNGLLTIFTGCKP